MRRGAARHQLEREYRRYVVAVTDRATPCVRCNAPGQIWSAASNGVVCATCYRATLQGGVDEGPARQQAHISHP